MDSYKIYENCDQYTAFPEADDVFVSDFEKDNLLPFGILQVDVGGIVHDVLIAAPIADDEGMIGRQNVGEHCGGTWLTYSMQGGKWALDCRADELLPFDINRAAAKESFQTRKAYFIQNNFIPSRDPKSEEGAPLFEIRKEKPTTYENWFGNIRDDVKHKLEDIPGREEDVKKRFSLVSDDGHEYLRLGLAYGGVYTDVLIPIIHFYYEPESKRVLVIHEFF